MTSDPLQIVASTADAAFAVDEDCRIVIWNKAAEELTGKSAAEVLGEPCYEVLAGRDVFGNRFCGQNCALHRMARHHEGISSFEVDFTLERGDTLRVGVSVIVVPGPRRQQYSMIHLLRPVSTGSEDDGLPEAPAGHPSSHAPASPSQRTALDSLTPREIEILEVLAKGWSTREIADRFYISVATVRNHVQNVLRKLEVHSKLEAVSLALRERII